LASAHRESQKCLNSKIQTFSNQHTAGWRFAVESWQLIVGLAPLYVFLRNWKNFTTQLNSTAIDISVEVCKFEFDRRWQDSAEMASATADGCSPPTYSTYAEAMIKSDVTQLCQLILWKFIPNFPCHYPDNQLHDKAGDMP
jgi:hypothetical protein